GRLLENRRLNIVKELDCSYKKFSYGELKQDCPAQLYKRAEKRAKMENLSDIRFWMKVFFA
ncbi:MAG: hypothetical protein LBC89_02800, partial [Bacteroidales bacterium]|nr:hypothetical protein [Bacteroidales bacterium]